MTEREGKKLILVLVSVNQRKPRIPLGFHTAGRHGIGPGHLHFRSRVLNKVDKGRNKVLTKALISCLNDIF